VAGGQVDFYLLGGGEPRDRLRTACRLAEKAYEQGLAVTLRAASPGEAVELDELLWTFSDRSFVPHAVWPLDAELAAESPVLVTGGELPPSHRDVLVNLAADLPDAVPGYGRILEIVAADEESKSLARARWRRYREAGLDPKSHTL